mgnify:CR=1 FL=1
MFDAEGHADGPPCPACGAAPSWRFTYDEGFDEYECPSCAWRSDEAELGELRRFGGEVLERERAVPPPPVGRPLRA